MSESDVFLVFVDGKPGHEEAYARWFSGAHMADMRALPGVTRAFAGGLGALDGMPPPAQLCGYYETPDCGELLRTIAESKGTAALPASDLQGNMVWRVLETVASHGEGNSAGQDAGLLIFMFPRELDESVQLSDLPVASARLTRIGAIQPARGREFGSVLFFRLSEEADPAVVAAVIADRCGTEGVRFLLAAPERSASS